MFGADVLATGNRTIPGEKAMFELMLNPPLRFDDNTAADSRFDRHPPGDASQRLGSLAAPRAYFGSTMVGRYRVSTLRASRDSPGAIVERAMPIGQPYLMTISPVAMALAANL